MNSDLHDESRILEWRSLDTYKKLLHMLKFTPYLRKLRPPPQSSRWKHLQEPCIEIQHLNNKQRNQKAVKTTEKHEKSSEFPRETIGKFKVFDVKFCLFSGVADFSVVVFTQDFVVLWHAASCWKKFCSYSESCCLSGRNFFVTFEFWCWNLLCRRISASRWLGGLRLSREHAALTIFPSSCIGRVKRF